MKKLLLAITTSTLLFADTELGSKFKNVVDSLISILNSGPVASIFTLVIIICGMCLYFKAFEKAKWLFISGISGTIVIYSATYLSKLFIDAAAG